jgi:hypothetical protein
LVYAIKNNELKNYNMKFATHVLLFSQDKWILKNIDNSGPFVDKIYISWSDEPWTYNKDARGNFKNKSNLELLKKSKYYDKIEIISGVWDTEESQRNACVDKAKKDDIDYLITHDADEFYTYDTFAKLINDIKENPNYDFYTTPWVSFWKTFDNIIVGENGSTIIGFPEIAINIKKGIRFVRCRKPSGTKVKQLDCLCYHASYVLNDEECWDKISTWGHTHQFDREKWYKTKWLNCRNPGCKRR